MAPYIPSLGPLVTIRNPYAEPLTPEAATAMGYIATRRDSSGALAGVYHVDGDAEIEALRGLGLVVEYVREGE